MQDRLQEALKVQDVEYADIRVEELTESGDDYEYEPPAEVHE